MAGQSKVRTECGSSWASGELKIEMLRPAMQQLATDRPTDRYVDHDRKRTHRRAGTYRFGHADIKLAVMYVVVHGSEFEI